MALSINWIVFISLLLDLLAFTMILPLFPSTLDCYGKNDKSNLYSKFESLVVSSQQLIGSPDKFNKALLGGLLGSWYSLLQFMSMPIIGSLSDVYGRRVMYLLCLLGITLSYLLWVISDNSFLLFVLFRTLGGLSKGNVSLTTAIVTDTSTEEKRGKGFAMIGIAFSIGFTFGPLIGALLVSLSTLNEGESGSCIQSYPPLVSLALSMINMVFSYSMLPETLVKSKSKKLINGVSRSLDYLNPFALFSFKVVEGLSSNDREKLQMGGYINFLYLFIYSGLEYTLAFFTFIRFDYTSVQQGKLYFFIGIVMLLTQSGMRSISVTHYHRILLSSIVAVIPAFIVIALSYSMPPFIAGLVLYSFSSATFVPSLSTLISTVGESNQKGLILGVFRSIGALARALGPITASIIFWKFGIEVAYFIGALSFLAPVYLAHKFRHRIAMAKSE